MSEMREDPRFPGVLIHQSSYVDDGAVLGRGTKVWHFCHILSRTVIGENCSIGQNVMIGPNVRIGNGCKIQNNVSIYDGVVLEDDVFVGPSAVFTNVRNPRAAVNRKAEMEPTLVGRGVTIGANATVLCGVRVGEYAFVAAGAVITRNVVPHAVMAGVPARRTAWVCRCGGRIGPRADIVCGDCRSGQWPHRNAHHSIR